MKIFKGLLGLNKAPQIILPAQGAPPTIDDPAVEAARQTALRKARRNAGYASTLVTGGAGVTNAASVTRPSLFGA